MLTPLSVREDEGRLCYVLTTNFTNYTNIRVISVICCFFFLARKITMFFLPRADILNLPTPHHVRMA